MNYFLLKLQFSSPLHVGDSESARSLDTSGMTICADTLFSALCHTALLAEGENGIRELYQLVTQDMIRFSDAIPYSGDLLFLPKPYLSSRGKREVTSQEEKAMKKLTHIPIDMIEEYISFIRGESDFDVKKAICSFGENYVLDKAVIRGEETNPYSVGLFDFNKEPICGLYVIIGYTAREELQKIIRLFRLAGIGGIGGKVSSGYGKYTIIDEIYMEESKDKQMVLFRKMLQRTSSNSYILITSAFPKDNELEQVVQGSTYNLIRRGGFVQSNSIDTGVVKKQTQYFFAAGSVFKMKFDGEVFNVARNIGHAVYRYSKPIFLGVNL